MNKPNFLRKFCIIGLGSTEELKEDLTVISETSVNFVSGEGLIIATFETAFVLPEIEELLKMTDRSYIIFEMTAGFFSASIENKEFQQALFGGEINSDNNSFRLMEEALNKIRKGDFSNFNDKDNHMLNITLKTDEELLEEAINNEDYEAAAKLRDKIKKNK
jgi:hypothetical protein